MSDPVTRATNDYLQAAVERAVRASASALLAREISVGEALASVAAVMGGEGTMSATPRELAAAGRLAYREMVVAEIVRLENQGRGRDAVSIVVDDHVKDRRDPVEVESLERKFRRWRCAEKRTPVRLPSSKSNRG